MGHLVPEKSFEGFLPYKLAWRQPWSCDPDAANKLLSGSTQNLAFIGQAALEKMMFEIVDNDGRTADGRRIILYQRKTQSTKEHNSIKENKTTGESAEQFIRALYEIAEHCYFKETKLTRSGTSL